MTRQCASTTGATGALLAYYACLVKLKSVPEAICRIHLSLLSRIMPPVMRGWCLVYLRRCPGSHASACVSASEQVPR